MNDSVSRIKAATVCIVGDRIVTREEVLKIAKTIAPLCGYIYGVDVPLRDIAIDIICEEISNQVPL